MSAIRFELHAYRRLSLLTYEPHPYRVLVSGVLTATTSTPSDAITVPDSGEDRIVLKAAIETIADPGPPQKAFLSFLALSEPGQAPRPDLDPRFLVNSYAGPLEVMVRSGQRFAILDTGKTFG